jgi:phosphoribosyl 1,2-cyclic phosphodiesterase
MNIGFRICVLGSGSSGNALLIATDETKILVDAGFSYKETLSRLNELEVSPEEIKAVVVTHEHSDHVKGLALIAKRLSIPVYLTKGTWEALNKKLKDDISLTQTFSSGEDFEIGDIGLKSFPVLHDAAEPVGFSFNYNGMRVGLATDLGKVTHLVRESLRGSTCLILESNHDPGMLIRGPYPWWLKQRIKGGFGHLSNEDSALLLAELLHENLTHVILAHVSKTNNQYEIVHLNALKVLEENKYQQVNVQVADQDRVSRPVEIMN